MTEIVKAAEENLQKYLTAQGLAKKLTTEQTTQFVEIAKAYGLNPFKREIYAIKYGDNFNIIVGYETYIKQAEASGLLDGWKVEIAPDMSATITIYRKDFKQPFVHTVYFEEYNQNTKIWKEKPKTMIKKVAISQGFRMCFNQVLGGLPYTAEEIVTEEQGYANFQEVAELPGTLQMGIDAIKGCESLDELKNVWTNFKELQKHPEFIEAKEKQKEVLNG